MGKTKKRDKEEFVPLPEAPKIPDPLGDLLVEKGLVPNEFVLDLNGTLSPGYDDPEPPPPWNLPSRLFQFPIEVSPQLEDGTRRIGLMHPLLCDHPFVKQVEAAIGYKIEAIGAPNEAGYTKTDGLHLWWHACDLARHNMWDELFETRRFTTDEHIAQAVEHQLHSRGKKFTPKTAAAVLKRLGIKSPLNPAMSIRKFMAPSPCQSDGPKSPVNWPVNTAFSDTAPGKNAWAMIWGIDNGWFGYRGPYINWTDKGRQLYAAKANAPTYVESKTGQVGFAF